jgi:hypothetical protein
VAEIEDLAMKVVHAYEDNYFDRAKRDVFDTLFNRYLGMVDLAGDMDPYEAVVSLGRQYRPEFDQLVTALRDRKLI